MLFLPSLRRLWTSLCDSWKIPRPGNVHVEIRGMYILIILDHYIYIILWIYYGYIMDILWIYYGYIIDILWIYYGYIVDILWVYYGYIMDILWIYYGYIMDMIGNVWMISSFSGRMISQRRLTGLSCYWNPKYHRERICFVSGFQNHSICVILNWTWFKYLSFFEYGLNTCLPYLINLETFGHGMMIPNGGHIL